MSWKLVPPRPGKTRFYYVRGKYCGIALDDSTGATEERAARRIFDTWKKQAERGEFNRKRDEPVATEVKESETEVPTFLKAAVAYMQANGPSDYIEPILERWGELPLNKIDQILIDTTAEELYPGYPASTKNRCFYTPVSAILKRAGLDKPLKRPKGWRGNKATSWLEPEQAVRLIAEAYRVDPEFGLFCLVALYTGMRLSDLCGIRLGWVKLNVKRPMIYLPKTKNTEPRAVYLPKPAVDGLKAQPPRPTRERVKLRLVKRRARKAMTPHMQIAANMQLGKSIGRSQEDAGIPFLDRPANRKLFRFHPSGYLRELLKTAMKNAGLEFPRRQCGFHLFCHTYGTWLDRYGDLDAYQMTRTDRWKDPRSADRYRHGKVSEESMRADLFPALTLDQILGDAAGRGADVERHSDAG